MRMAPRCICRKVGKLFPGEPVELGHVPQRDAPAGELDDAGVLPLLEHPGDHLAGRGDAVGDALVGGDHGRRALLGILEQKMHRKTLREILEQEILHVEKNAIEQSEDRAKDGVLNAQIGVQHGLEIGERHDDGANVHLRFQLIVVENLRRWVAAGVNDVLAPTEMVTWCADAETREIRARPERKAIIPMPVRPRSEIFSPAYQSLMVEWVRRESATAGEMCSRKGSIPSRD